MQSFFVFWMEWYVYILRSDADGTYYKGSSEDYVQRFEDHNAGKSQYTSTKCPWQLICVGVHPGRRNK